MAFLNEMTTAAECQANRSDGETEQGRMFTICKHRWSSGCPAEVVGHSVGGRILLVAVDHGFHVGEARVPFFGPCVASSSFTRTKATASEKPYNHINPDDRPPVFAPLPMLVRQGLGLCQQPGLPVAPAVCSPANCSDVYLFLGISPPFSGPGY